MKTTIEMKVVSVFIREWFYGSASEHETVQELQLKDSRVDKGKIDGGCFKDGLTIVVPEGAGCFRPGSTVTVTVEAPSNEAENA